MGFLDDLWHDIQVFFIDISSYSEAEKNKDKYRKAADELSEEISSCQSTFDTVKTACTDLSTSFTSNAGAADGDWKERFDTKESLWDERKNTVLTTMENALSTARDRQAEAERLAGYWEEQERAEERRVRNEVHHEKEEKARQEREERRESNG